MPQLRECPGSHLYTCVHACERGVNECTKLRLSSYVCASDCGLVADAHLTYAQSHATRCTQQRALHAQQYHGTYNVGGAERSLTTLSIWHSCVSVYDLCLLTRTHTHMYARTQTHTRIHRHTHAHTYIRTCAYSYTYRGTDDRSGWLAG